MKHWIAAAALAGISSWAQADGLQSLEQFIKNAQAGEASFTQTVTSPAKEGQAQRVKKSSGSFAFQRPGKFKFVYKKPFDQTIVADGSTLTMFDADLNQGAITDAEAKLRRMKIQREADFYGAMDGASKFVKGDAIAAIIIIIINITGGFVIGMVQRNLTALQALQKKWTTYQTTFCDVICTEN